MMPLFMDLHISPNGEIAIEDLIEKHQADLTVQHKYGVEFKGVWVNKNQGMVFCLMEGPDKKSCSCVHQEAHGDNGCNVVEVSPGDYQSFLSNGFINEKDIAETEKDVMDTAYRTILLLEMTDPFKRQQLNFRKIKQLIKKNRGILLLDPQSSVKAVFVYPSGAFRCATQIKSFMDINDTDLKLVIVSGKPVEKNHDKFYGYMMDLSHKMSILGHKGIIRTTQLTLELLKKEGKNENDLLTYTETLSAQDEQFLNKLMKIIQENFKDPDFNVKEISKDTHLSRSQLFKKVKRLTGYTPNILIREFRLIEALKLLDQKEDQIAQIAFDTGFNSPSWFSKIFAKRFHMLPSEYMTENRH